MFPLRKLNEEEIEAIKEERKKRRQELFKKLGTTLERLLGELLVNAREILYPRDFKDTITLTKTKQKEKVAIFWDYENFALPKSKVAVELFFSMLYPSKKRFEIVSKNVFSKIQHINPHLPVLIDEGFEFFETKTSEKNATDKLLIKNCKNFCTQNQEKVIIILITGDKGYIELIKFLVSNGHEVRLVHSSKEAISKEMKRLVPIVLDINTLFKKRKSELERKMLREENSEKWENLWKEYLVLEVRTDQQEVTLNKIAREAKITTIRSRAQNHLINLVEDMKQSKK